MQGDDLDSRKTSGTSSEYGEDDIEQINAKTEALEKGAPVPVVITVYEDRSITFETKTPPASFLLKKAAGIKSGSGRPNTEKVGTVTRAQLEEIATVKMEDLTASDMDAAVRTIAGSARSMGLNVEGVI